MRVDAEKLASVASEGRRILEAARRDPGRTVPFYPQWTLNDLVTHTASIHALATRAVRDLPAERVSRPRLPDDVEPIEWYRKNLDGLIEAFQEADSTAPVWGFGGGSTVSHWLTRMVVETGVHRWDAEQAFGEEGDLTPIVARTGMDEFTTMWFPLVTDAQVLQATATDTGQTWVYGHGEPTASIEGTESDIYLALMTRPSRVVLPEDWARAAANLPLPPELR